ncbi:MAG: hydrogenase formation protein HypD [Pseudomonadota bacterium]
MEFSPDFRDPSAAQRYAAAIARQISQPWTIMEVCGGQTHAIVRYGIEQLLPDSLTLVHGPGCPVCVTPPDYLDHAITLAHRPGVILTTFADMLRVPGNQGDLARARAEGADVRAVTSPLAALALARANPDQEIVFLAVGFETTAPAVALAVHQAASEGCRNFSLLVAHVLVPPALTALLAAPDNSVQGFLAAGHVCAVTGTTAYNAIAERWQVPIVATGFEPLDILHGIAMAIAQLESGRAEVENQYSRAVREDGNPAAQKLLAEIFDTVPRRWRGLGLIPASGFALASAYRRFDAEARFGAIPVVEETTTPCIAGTILRGQAKPRDCPAFASRCTPEHPLGPTMVSSEGACAAYFRYQRTHVSSGHG